MTTSISQAVHVHAWLCGLDANSQKEHHEAARQDLLAHGGLFAWRGGPDAFGKWFKRLGGRREGLAMTTATGCDEWWWSGLDRCNGLTLTELGAWGAGPDQVPVAPPMGMTYGDLADAVLASVGVKPWRPSGPAPGNTAHQHGR